MDAASHTGIDDIRDIIEQVRYAPVSARYKVYIIDEVHMLSNQAFNGLLKTLEEPPPHVKFIFATTEIRKVPITILSRCQRFDLRRIDATLIKQHLAHIGELEKVEAEDEALAMIARAAEGSMRDAQSIFDQAIAHSQGQVSAQTVRDMLGLVDRARVIDLFEMVMKGDIAAALTDFRAQYDAGADPATVLTELAEFNHLVTRMRFLPSAADDAALSQDERARGLEFSQTLSVRILSRTWQMLLKGISEVQNAARPVNAAEMALIRLAHAANLPTLDEALKALENGASTSPEASRPSGGSGSGSSGPGAQAPNVHAAAQSRLSPQPSGGAQAMRLVTSQPQATPTFSPAPAAEDVQSGPHIASLADIAALADQHRDIAFKVLLKRCVRPVRLENGHIEVSLTADAPRTLLNDLSTRLQDWTGRRWVVALSREEGGQTIGETETARRESAFSDARSDPAVAAILSRFPGAKVIDVRIPDAPEVTDEMDGMAAPEAGFGEDDDEF